MAKELEEYLRLPRDIVDRGEEWEKRTREILKQHANSGRRIGCDVKRYAPIAYRSTFQKSGDTAKDRSYEFESKTGDQLMITSDSTPLVMREYIASGERKEKRTAFIVPMVRHRNKNRPYRNYSQVGYSIINATKSEGEIDFALIQVAKSMKDLYDSTGVKMKIHLNNYAPLKAILTQYISEEELPDFLYQIRFGSVEERNELLTSTITDKQKCEQLIELFGREAKKIEPGDEKENSLNLPEEYLGIYQVAQALKDYANADVYFDPANLQSAETVDNYYFRFVSSDGVHLGDGGEYTSYAKGFHSEITSLYSVASALEEIERNSSMELSPDTMKKVAILNMNSDPMFILEVIKELESRGFAAIYKGATGNIGKAIKKLGEDYTHISVLGENERTLEDVIVKDLATRESVPLTSVSLDPLSEEVEGIINRTESSQVARNLAQIMQDYVRTDEFDRGKLLKLIADHAEGNDSMLLKATDIEALVQVMGALYREKGLIKDGIPDDREKE